MEEKYQKIYILIQRQIQNLLEADFEENMKYLVGENFIPKEYGGSDPWNKPPVILPYKSKYENRIIDLIELAKYIKGKMTEGQHKEREVVFITFEGSLAEKNLIKLFQEEASEQLDKIKTIKLETSDREAYEAYLSLSKEEFNKQLVEFMKARDGIKI